MLTVYDPLGNITQINDFSGTNASRTVLYGYDTLSRLTSASTTAASSTPYIRRFAYDLIGNILSAFTGTASSTYAYTQPGYTNPDAVTSIGDGTATTTYVYDNNGNLTGSMLTGAASSTFSYDYANRLTQASVGSSTSTYGYDTKGSRAFQGTGMATTTYASQSYSTVATQSGATTTATSTLSIYLGDALMGTIDQILVNGVATGTPTTRYVHADHLGSTNVVTDEARNVVQTLDYYPYGQTRVNSQASSTNIKRKYIGQFADDTTSLSYLNARYYAPDRGQFVSQDPVFWEIGQTRDGNAALANPQALNSYGYGNNNPITNKDPGGRSVSEYQPYLPTATLYGYGDPLGSYRGVDIISHGSRSSDDYPVNQYQCVDFAKRFAQQQFGINTGGTGNAVSYGDQGAINAAMKNNRNAGFLQFYANNGAAMPQQNDLISWSGHGAGHVGVIAEVSFNTTSGSGFVYTLEQNTRRDQALFVQPLTRNSDGNFIVGNRLSGYNVQGWARYGNQSAPSQYTTTPWTPAPKVPTKAPAKTSP